ncbi:MAG TPA: cytochrome c-type biogenesis protein CcmH [Acidimicrobiales bacterium]|nr:cytochrome c-type biogenesis protein CcmH [Acidimicrobiales bacterium]
MSVRRLAWVALGMVATVTFAFAVLNGGSTPETPAARSERLAAGIRCPTCQGLSAAESDAKAASAVRAEITRRVVEGQSDAEIRQALVDRYGRGILLTPEGQGVAALVWAVPVVVVVVAGAALALRLRGAPKVGDVGVRSRPTLVKRAALAGVVIAAAVGAGTVVARTAGERLPGESATGSVDLGPAQLLIEARRRLEQGDAVEALRLYDRVLEQDRAHPEALAYRGWLVRLAGQTQEGLDLVDTAIAADPEYADARLFKGVMLLEDLNQPAAAAEELRRFLDLAPESEFAAQARASLAQAEAAT